jgi:hypothetical protein
VKARALAALLVASAAHAHSVPGGRDVVVQAEADAVAILVSYRPSTETWIPPQPGKERARLALARRALAVLEVKLDGVPLEGKLELKLGEENGRPLLVALLTAPVPAGRRRLTVDVAADREPTATRWLDRSGGRVASAGPRPAGESFQDRGQLVVEWR